MDKAQFKSISLIALFFVVMAMLIYAVSTTLTSPADNVIDNDGYLNLIATCDPTAATGNTMYNITNATLYSNVDGTWKANKTLIVTQPKANGTYYANFTNYINRSSEGNFKWNVECHEQNETGSKINKAFAGNNSITVQYAAITLTLDSTSPVDGYIDLDGRPDSNSNFTATASTTAELWNITSIQIFTNISGTWKMNKTQSVTNPVRSSTMLGNFTLGAVGGALPDGSVIVWSIAATEEFANASAADGGTTNKTFFTVNRTFLVEYPNNISINNPSGNWSKDASVDINFTIDGNKFGNGPTYFCIVYSNETGPWSTLTGGFNANNGTNRQRVTFGEKTSTNYAIKCASNSNTNIYNYSVNTSISIDTINPTISVATENTTFNKSNTEITFTVTDLNIFAFRVLANFNASSESAFVINTTPSTGVQTTIHFRDLNDGIYNVSIFANDTSGRSFVTSNFTITVDNTASDITGITNATIDNSCDRLNISWTTNESTNFTIDYGIDTNITTRYSNASKGTSNSFILNFGINGETKYYFNISSYDTGNNLNKSTQFNLITPARVCSGWNYYAIYDAYINLSVIQNQSGANLVYFWNQSKQNWVFYTAGTSTNGGTLIGRDTTFHVVQLYESINSTWRRNQTIRGYFDYNITHGDNFIYAVTNYTFGNLTQSFMNVFGNNATGNSSNSSGYYPSFLWNNTEDANTAGFPLQNLSYGPFNITFLAGYNNSAQRWSNHVFNTTWNNNTALAPLSLEVFWEKCY